MSSPSTSRWRRDSAVRSVRNSQTPAHHGSGLSRGIAGLLGGALILGSSVVVATLPTVASTGGTAQTIPATATLSPLTVSGNLSGLLSSFLDLPIPLGDHGDYEIAGISAPAGDATGNAVESQALPVGPIDGVLTDPEDGAVDEEPGRGFDIGGGSQTITRSPAGLVAQVEVIDAVLDIAQLNDTVGAVLEADEIVRVDHIVTRTVASVTGDVSTDTHMDNLRLLGVPVALVDGRLTGPVSDTINVESNDVPALLRSLGVDEEDIDQYAGLINSSSLNATFTVTLSEATTGGLGVSGRIQLTASASAGALGSAQVWADDIVITAQIAGATATAPNPLNPQVTTMSPTQVDPGDQVSVTGVGFIPEATTVVVAGANATGVTVNSQGTTLTFVVPSGLASGDHSVTLSTAGGEVNAGDLSLSGPEIVPLTLTGINPGTASENQTVTLTGTGFVADRTSIILQDASGGDFVIATEDIQINASGVTLSFVVPEGVIAGSATITVIVRDEQAEVSIEIAPITLDPVAITGSATITGYDYANTQVSLTVDNSSFMTWTVPTLINPAGTAGNGTDLVVGLPELNGAGLGQVSDSGAGFTGTVTRSLEQLQAQAVAEDYSLVLPAPWDEFFAAGDVVTADRIEASAVARVDDSSSGVTTFTNLRVLGQEVPLQDGRLTQPFEHSITLDRDALRNREAMNGVFFSAANEAYNRAQSATQATLWVTLTPIDTVTDPGSASIGAFTVEFSLRYQYSGENGGWASTRARHGSGANRDGERVIFHTADVAQISVSSPEPILPEVTGASPRLVDASDEVTLIGRGFTPDTVINFGDASINPTEIALDGTSATFTVPAGAEPGPVVTTVTTYAGTSSLSRTILVTGLPEIIQQPQDVSIREGQDATFSATATGYPTPTLQWQRLVEGEWQDVEGATTETYTFTPDNQDDGAELRVLASNAKGQTPSENATLIYQYLPVVTESPVAGQWAAGQVATLNVSGQANPAATVQWEINRGAGWALIPGATTPVLELALTAQDHGAQVRAVLTNALGSVESEEVDLWVSYAPIILTHPVAEVTLITGEELNLEASAEGNPEPSVQWQYRHPLGGQWIDIDAETHPSALTTNLSIPVRLGYDGLLFRALFSNSPDATVPSASTTLMVLPDNPTPAPTDLSVLASPLSIGALEIPAAGEATGGNLAGLVNAELSKGVFIGEPGTFFLPELGAPTSPGELTAEHAAGSAHGLDSGDLASGASYGDVTVQNLWDSEGIRSKAHVDHVTIDHLALDNKGRIGGLLGMEEILHVTQVESTSFAPSDNDHPTHASSRIGELRLLGDPVTEADGLIDGRLSEPITRTATVTLEDPAAVAAQLGIDISAYLSQPLLGSATATVRVTVSQPQRTEADTVFFTGLYVELEAEFAADLQTQGADQALIERAQISTEGFQEVLNVEIAATAAARNGAELPDPTDVPAGPGEPTDPTDPGVPPLPIDEYRPSGLPDRVISTPGADPATSRSLTWRTDEHIATGFAEYFVSTGDEEGDQLARENSDRLQAVTSDSFTRRGTQGGEFIDFSARSHAATLTGLAPSTTYSVRVGDGEENWSQWYTFTTAASSAEPFEFLYFGDAQNDLRAYWADSAREAFERFPNAALTVHAGDQVNHAENEVQWGEWFDAAPEVMASMLQVPVTGNHEYESGALSSAWHNSYTLPSNGPRVDPTADACTQAYQAKMQQTLANQVYYFDYQGVRFVQLSSNLALGDIMPGGEAIIEAGCDENSVDWVTAWSDFQGQWLDQVLEENPHQWSVVSFHFPVFSTSVGRSNPHIRDAWLPILEKHNVDLVLQGHDHTYGRGHVQANEVADQPGVQRGPVYVVSVLGPKFYELNTAENNDWTSNGARQVTGYENTRTYQHIQIDGGRLTYSAHEFGTGEVVDAFSICKNSAGSKLVAEAGVSLPEDCDARVDEPGSDDGDDDNGGEQPSAPSVDDLTPQTRSGISVPDTAVAGNDIEIGFDASWVGEQVHVYLFSTPVSLGEHTVSAGGQVRVTLPADALGTYRIAAYALDGTLIGWDVIVVTAASELPGGGGDDSDDDGATGGSQPGGGSVGADGGTSPRPSTPNTGADLTAMVGIALLLLVVGGTGVALRRKREQSASGL